MAHPLFRDIFFRLPPATAVLLLNAVFCLSNAHLLPRQTKVVGPHELDVIALPLPAPTPAPSPPSRLHLRQENTICGYLGGNSDFPATCSLGSHCVLDLANLVVGCCPNGGMCTTGVFTGCVDRNSSPQTEINPYVYSCHGSDVCFKNSFAGGFYQYGCGTASELGTTVETSAKGASSALSIETVYMSLTESPTPLATPTTIGSVASTAPTSLGQSSSHSTIATSPSTSPPSAKASPPSAITSHSSVLTSHSSAGMEGSGAVKQSQNSAIIGGIVGGTAAAVSLVALVFFCARRRNRNHRRGPGPTPTPPPTTEYSSPMQQTQSQRGAFAPLPSWHDEEVSSSDMFHSHPHPQPPESYGPLESTRSRVSSFHGHPNLHTPDPYAPLEADISAPPPANLGPAAHGFPQPLRYNPVYMPTSMQQPKGSLTPVVEEDQSIEREDPPQGREIDDFSRAYSSAGIGQLSDAGGDEDRTPLRANARGTEDDDEEEFPGRSAGHRPLWQQNRQQSRNLMWL
ncbi:hypothetical protein F4861DRAFT_545888 [Xylaria intraflava]|nr:hypothetical protein F4861DRAFT_545888 [Xylaria intraflava]